VTKTAVTKTGGDQIRVTVCTETPGLLSEGPRWIDDSEELMWVDVLASQLFRAKIDSRGLLKSPVTVQLDRHVGAAAPVVGGGYVVAAGTGFLFVDRQGAVRELAQAEAGRTDVRMNDGACDPQGRFWAGTMAYDESPGAGVLYRLELDGTCTTVLTGLTISNGIGWSPEGTVMYLADSGAATIDAFAFDPTTGDLRDRRTVMRIDEDGIAPDGLTVDDRGDIWVALWGGGVLRRYHPDGSLLATVAVPVDRPTSCAFGGPGRSTLFVTTAREGLDQASLQRQPDAGRLFRIDGLDASGPACAPYRGQIPLP
jgi:sugar lactone lactonase YvrE